MAVGKRGKALVIDFRCYLPNGKRVRCVEREGPDNEKNRKRVHQKWKAIQYHLHQNTFDYNKFFPHGSKGKYFESTTDITYSKFYSEWVEGFAVRRGTSDHYESIYKTHHKPYFGEWKLSDITDHEIRVYRKKMIDKGYAASTVNQNIKVLCMSLKTAARQGLIPVYPCEDIKRVKESKVQVNPLSFEELNHWLDYLDKDPEWYDLILFWSRTGLRPGELMALRWENVDFFNNQIMICENRPLHGGVGPTKTEASDRVINMRPAVKVALKRQQGRSGLMNKYVFLNHRQNQWCSTTLREAFKFQLRLAGLKIRPIKEMRHTFATLHIGSGESITWVSKTLGHSNVEITLKRYNRFIPNLTREDGSAFEKALNGND